jgi:hypothetical protein
VDAPKLEPAPGREAVHKARLAKETNRLLDKWCVKAVDDVTAALRAAVTERAKAFEKATGFKIILRPAVGEAAPQLSKHLLPSSFMTLSLGDAAVHIYVSRVPGELPILHYAVDAGALLPPMSSRSGPRPGAAAGSQRLVSTPACLIARGPDGRPRLKAPGTGEDGPLVKLDDLVFSAFERLVDTFEAYGA